MRISTGIDQRPGRQAKARTSHFTLKTGIFRSLISGIHPGFPQALGFSEAAHGRERECTLARHSGRRDSLRGTPRCARGVEPPTGICLAALGICVAGSNLHHPEIEQGWAIRPRPIRQRAKGFARFASRRLRRRTGDASSPSAHPPPVLAPCLMWQKAGHAARPSAIAGDRIRTGDVQLGKRRYGQSNALVAQRLRHSLPVGDQLGAHVPDASRRGREAPLLRVAKHAPAMLPGTQALGSTPGAWFVSGSERPSGGGSGWLAKSAHNRRVMRSNPTPSMLLGTQALGWTPGAWFVSGSERPSGGGSGWLAKSAHNCRVAGSNPTPASS